MKECKCKLCDSLFIKVGFSDNAKKYCSDECSAIAHKRQSRINAYKWKYDEEMPEVSECKFCGSEFNNLDISKRGYCSEYCKKQYTRFSRKRIVRSCKVCGKEFYQGEDEQAFLEFCGLDCRNEYRRMSVKNWQSYKSRCNKTDYTPIPCAYCGKEFVRTKGQPKQKYCSSKCGYRAAKGVTEKALLCKTCGKEFKTFTSSVYCSDECRNYKEPEQIEIRFCKKCNKAFAVGSKSVQVYCSKECKNTPIMYHHTCEICGAKFDNWQPEQYACSGKCKGVRDRRKSKELRTDHGKVKERFEPEKIIDNGITWKKIMLKDGCNCRICGLPVDVEDYSHTKNGAFIAGPNYPSIDHIVPRAKGGEHSWGNVQLAHFYCNTIKCDNMEAII